MALLDVRSALMQALDVRARRLSPAAAFTRLILACSGLRRITGQPWLRLRYDARQCMQEVRARHNADKLIIAHHEYAIDLVAFHDMDDLIEPTVSFYRSHVRSHHVAHLAADRLQILCG